MGIYDPMRGVVVSADRHIAACAGCGKEMLKKRMFTILSKRGYNNPRTITHLCAECYAALCDRYEIDI